MLDVSAKNLYEEVCSAERFRDAHLSRVPSMVENYVGDSYRTDLNGQWSENNYYEFIRLTTGKIIFDNPKTRVKTRRPATQRLVAQAMQYGLNRWVRDVKLRRLLKRVYAAQCFCYSVVQTVIEPQPWMDPRKASMPHWPQCYVIESDRFGFDPLCTWFGAARYSFHKFVRDKEDLLDEAEMHPEMGWNTDAINAIGADSGIENLKRGGSSDRQSLTRKEIVLYDVWVPEMETGDPQMGFHGTIYTIAASPSSDRNGGDYGYIREPRPYYGPRWGPYTLFGVYPVPGDPYPLAPFVATRPQSQDMNDVARSTNKAINEYKRLVLCSAENPDLAMKLKKPDNLVLTVKGFNKDQVEVIEIGGVTEQHLKQLEIMLARGDRNIGISQTQQGKVTGATATEIAEVGAAASDSLSYIKQEFTDAVVQVLDSAGWALYHDDRIEFPLGEDAAAALVDPMTGQSMVEPWFAGGSHLDDSGAKYDDLELEIEPYSMERMNEALMRAQYAEMMELAIASAAVIPTAPFFDWKKLFDKGGEVMNDPTFGEFYNAETANVMQMMTAQQQVMEQKETGTSIQVNQAAAAGQMVSAAVDAQKPGLEREKIATQRAGLAQKNAQKGKPKK